MNHDFVLASLAVAATLVAVVWLALVAASSPAIRGCVLSLLMVGATVVTVAWLVIVVIFPS